MNELQLSQSKVGFTSAMKMGFVFNDESEHLNEPNHVITEFSATNEAVELIENSQDSKVMVVDYNDSFMVVSVDEAKKHNLHEVTLKVIFRETNHAEWIKETQMSLINVSADCNEMGNASEYENAIDRFAFWSDVQFSIDGIEHNAVAQFDCGYRGDVGEWSQIDSNLIGVSIRQDNFLDSCLDSAVKSMLDLKERSKANA